jgi:transposase-like protein
MVDLRDMLEPVDLGDEDACRAYMEALRWPDGVVCPRCESPRISRLQRRKKFHCHNCRYQFSITAGTLFHNSHLPLRKWFLATYLMVSADHGVSANQLHQILGGSYKTSWFLEHRIRAAMTAGTELPVKITSPAHAAEFGTGEAWSLLERSLDETYRQLSLKHLPAYWGEMEWRARHSDNPHVFRDTVLALIHGEALPYEQLTASH